jgi:hypothetical protein
MIYEKLNRLIPFVEEHVISYPLWEEGKYIPFLQLWRRGETETKRKSIQSKLKKLRKFTSYEAEVRHVSMPSGIIHYHIYPKFTESVDGGYEFMNKDWSIEEMLDLAYRMFD